MELPAHPPTDFLFSKSYQYRTIVGSNMGTNRGQFFTGLTFQIVALVAALSGVRAQSSTAIGVLSTGRGQHDKAAFVFGSTGQLSSGSFVSLPTQSNALSPTSSTASASFTYTPPDNPFTIFAQPNEPAITGNDLFSPLVDVLRTGIPGDPMGRLIPGAAGSTMDTSGANHFEASLAPHWVFCRHSRYPVTVTLPTQVTAREDPYYFGHNFGWIASGVNVRVPLSFIPKQYGKWSASTSADLCYYGTTTTEFVNSIGPQIPKVGAAFTLEL
jgi:hypothetical protein